MTDEKLKIYHQLYTNLWHLIKNYHEAETDKQWQELTDKAEELVQQYGEIARPLVIDTVELIERNQEKKISPK